MSVASTILVTLAALTAAYLLVGNLWHRVLSPLPPPDPRTFPRAGDRFVSRAENVEAEVLAIEDGWVVLRSVLGAHAAGPPLHTHVGFDEYITPVEGVLHVELRDRVIQLQPGETLHVPAGLAHRPFNPAPTPVVLQGSRPAMPLSFAASLVQQYRIMDERGTAPLTMMLQISVLDPIADTQLARVPTLARHVIGFVLAPAARLLGYRNYYPEYALHCAASEARHTGEWRLSAS
jgi:quercetin dioxygenase-like cupin family protein